MADGEQAAKADDRSFVGHPRGLGYLAFTEAWERFSFYGMQSLLVLYMTKALLLPGAREKVLLFEPFRRLFGSADGQPLASAIFGTYAAGVYLTPILGGLLADRLLGKRRTVLLGAVTMALGHFLMAFESTFLFALLALVLGCGMFKGNIASQVGALYAPDDLRRADAFQIFYLGINAGVIASPFVVGTLGERVGWHWGFGAAGVGMLLALAIYLAGQRHLAPEVGPAAAAAGRAARPPMTRDDWWAVAALLAMVPVLAVAIVPNNQIFNAYLVWGDQAFDLTVIGRTFPTTWLIALDAIVSVTFLALVVVFYRWYGRRWKEPDEITKIVVGSGFSVLGTLCLVAAAGSAAGGGKIGLFWPVMFHVVNSIAFAHMLPVSLALFAKVAPPALHATVLGVYYLAFFLGNSMVGWVGGYLERMPAARFWWLHAGFAAGAGVAFLLFRLLLRKRLRAHAPAAEAA
ncbi:MAG: peptide MFS transporter [Deltaproteobacteria bacterium]|nr:peptide MFS transporter [Deltaproteobacteria bacterium]